jgi:hypothetical protein
MRTAFAMLASLSLSACAAGKSHEAPGRTCFQWADLLKNGLIRPGLERSEVLRICQHFELPSNSSDRRLCSNGPADKQWDCLVDDYKCDRGDLAPGTVRVIYRSKEGLAGSRAGPDDVPGRIWVVEYSGFQEPDDRPSPRTPAETPKPGG